MRSRNTLQAVLEGTLIGAAGLIPGASGGIMAVAFGVYQEALDAIIGLFSNFKKSFSFLWPYGLGVAIGVFGCAFALEWLLKNWNMPFMYMLIGMVLGGIPSIIKEAGKPFSLKYAICSLLGAVLVAAIAMLDDKLTGSNPWEYNYLTAALAGGIIAIGIVIPGISTSFILMFMGLYEPLLSSLTRLELPYLICAGCSALIVGALLVVFVRNMFRRHPAGANYCVLGFLIGTTALIFPGFAPFFTELLYLALAATGFFLTTMMNRRTT